ncbi:MutS-related protein [Salinimicrobium terrae]|uniref:MutS-related protein n=1 Tax=Salinimicrobium terrae TaxID=470866 RepID=UPI00040A7A33|nr:DNA mismatch repair protein MutS [Salinimicrobium terrae]
MKIYRDNIKKYDAQLLKLSKALKRFSFLRLFIFVISGIVLIYLFSVDLITPVYIVFPLSIVCFGAAINYHSNIAYLKKHTAFLKSINEAEILREKCTLEEFDTGHKFIDQNHPYTSDLDIFGQHSVFQLVNRTTTESGMIFLSKWLSQPAPNSEIHDRQEAIKELSQKLGWRQDFQASGLHFQNKKSDYNKLLDWLKAPVALLKYRRIFKAAAILLPVLFLLSSYFFYANLDSPKAMIYLSLMILVLLINFIILRKLNPLAENIAEVSTKNYQTLEGYRTLINKIESESFKSKKLRDLQSILIHGKYSAFKEIKRLCSLLEFSQQRPIKKAPIGGNQFYPFLNLFLLLDIHLIIDTEKWRSKNKAYLKLWAEVVSEFEVINSFAGFCYSNPLYTFPEITEKNNSVHFESLGHPLIISDTRISNNFHSQGQGDVVMVTGSNMAGKSTFLRAVGVNIVLGLAGAPCCSKDAEISNLKLFSSMRTEDNLKRGISSFYAELSRIEKMLKLIKSNNNVFFLLDEMFKGTNSEDRHRGGFSFINQVSKLKTSGIIATHDIDLAKLSGDESLVTNYSFNSEIKDDSMIFNYELQPGICTDFNASVLMEKSGIEIIHVPKSEFQ